MTHQSWLLKIAPHATEKQIVDFVMRVERSTKKDLYRTRCNAFVAVMKRKNHD